MTEGSHWDGADLILAIQVQPRATRERILGMNGTSIKVALTSPPIEGAANQALCRFIAKELDLAKSRVKIQVGERSRKKRLQVQGPRKAAVQNFCTKWAVVLPT